MRALQGVRRRGRETARERRLPTGQARRAARNQPTFSKARGSIGRQVHHAPREGTHVVSQDTVRDAGVDRRGRAAGRCGRQRTRARPCGRKPAPARRVRHPRRGRARLRGRGQLPRGGGGRPPAQVHRLRAGHRARHRAARARRVHVPRQHRRRASSSCGSPAGASRPTRRASWPSSRPGCAIACSRAAA